MWGANWHDANGLSQSGRSYVIFGATDGAFAQTAVDYFGSTSSFSRAATAVGQTLAGNAGNDTLTSLGATVLLGGIGDDTLVFDAAMISALQTDGLVDGVYARVDGGAGNDSVRVSSNLDLTAIANQGKDAIGFSRLESIEIVDLLTDTSGQTLNLTSKDVIDMSDSNVFATTGRHQSAMRQNPNDWAMAKLLTVAKRYGMEVRNTGGQHYVFSHPSLKDPLSVPALRPIKAIYIKRFDALIDQIQE